ncbi:unnamed protein product [Zymoseptoria tritici ST99CH_3D1]|nr:unnamed protein product [Zymoseptoria tritici ST99CH_3D1]
MQSDSRANCAAEKSMKALSLVTDPDEKRKYSARVKQYMHDAERIKNGEDWTAVISPGKANAPDSGKVRLLKEPRNSRKLPTKEQIILLKAGFLNGVKFPLWTNAPDQSEFERAPGEDLFLDEASELPLSEFQSDVLDDWKRPDDALPPPSWYLGNQTGLAPTMDIYRDIDLVQDAATDCSVVASLCAAIARLARGHPKMLQCLMYPFDVAKDQPMLSKNGKYVISMNFNGGYRRVVIDDRIPTSSTNRVIHVIDRNHPNLLWPALVEKAYLKVRGGYDFPGSNSGTDVWILTGWIPEQVFLQSDDLEPDNFWRRILKGFSYGDVLITMGTGKMSRRTEKALGLAGEHDYAVLDLREVDGQRLMLIKNPWVEGTSWRGRFKDTTSDGHQYTEGDLRQLHDEMEPVNSPRDLLNVDDQLKPGTFWMDLDNVIQHFESVYLNWNAGLFSFRQDAHFAWDLSESPEAGSMQRTRGPYTSLQQHPQFTVTASNGGTIWLLLCRHFQNYVPEDATAEEIESGRQYIDLNGHISMVVFASRGRRVLLSERYLQKGWFVDSPQILLKLDDCEPNKTYTVVPLEQNLHSTNHTFTLSAFSNSPITLMDAGPRYAHVTALSGRWSKETAGGNAQNTTYYDNPQYNITISARTNISLLLEAHDQQLNVHVRLLHSNGQRVHRMGKKDIIVDSKDYRRGCCLAEIEDLDAGQYTIVCSTFEPDQLGAFNLRIDSSQPVCATLLPREGAGRIRTELKPAVFKQGESKVAAPLSPRRLMNFYIIAKQLNQKRSTTATSQRRSNHSHIRLSIELGRGPARRILIASHGGEYADSSAAVRTNPLDLGPDFVKYGYRDCWLVVDRMYVSSEEQEEGFAVELFVDQPNAVEVGGWRAWED